MARITLIVEGEAEFDREFVRLDATFSDLTPIWPDVRDKFWEIEEQQFDSEGSAGRSGKWKRLSKRYEVQKIARYGAGLKILQATGDLKSSLTGQTSDTIYRTSKDEIMIGTSLPYARHHHQGAGRLPQRKPIDLSERQREGLMKTIQGSLVKQIRRGVGYILPGDRG
jgi:phage gpG-like protein